MSSRFYGFGMHRNGRHTAMLWGLTAGLTAASNPGVEVSAPKGREAHNPKLDEVLALPGWDTETGPAPLPSRHYSGYLPVRPADDRNVHYYLK